MGKSRAVEGLQQRSTRALYVSLVRRTFLSLVYRFAMTTASFLSFGSRLSGAVCALLLAAVMVAAPALAQEDDRLNADRIIENLKIEIPQLRQAGSIQLGSFSESDVGGFRETTLIVNRREVPILVSDDGTRALLLASEPLDVSRTVEEVQSAMAEEAAEREKALDEAVAGMPVRGPEDAPVTLVEFSDFQCPYCARAATLVEQLRERYPEKLNVVYMHFPLPMHEWAEPAAIASQCAARQDEAAFWALHDLYFEKQDQMTADNVIAESSQALQDAGINLGEWRTCAADPSSDAYKEVQASVQNSLQAGQQLGVSGTPTFFVNGQQVQGARSVEDFASAIEKAASESGE